MRNAVVSLAALLAVGALVKRGALPAPPARAFADEGIYTPTKDCQVDLPWEHHGADGARLVRAVPASGASRLAFAWQDGDTIYVQQFLRDCSSAGDRVVVNRSQGFWQRPGDSGLGDVAVLGGGAAVAAWVLGDDVWFGVVNSSSAGPPVVASGASSPPRSRAEVKVYPLAAGEAGMPGAGFAVAWSSWGQDGDGWGVFARLFLADGTAVSRERQVNAYWRDFQWHPQLLRCGGALWALWANSSVAGCRSGAGGAACGHAAALRQLAAAQNGSQGDKDLLMGQEVAADSGGGTLVASAMACHDSGSDAMVVGLARSGDGLKVSLSRYPSTPLGQSGEDEISLVSRTSLDLAATTADDRDPSSVMDGGPPEPGALWAPAPATARHAPEEVVVDRRLQEVASGVTLLASSQFLLWLATDGGGTLEGQLLRLSADDSTVTEFPKRALVRGAGHAQAVWDLRGSRHALLLCWASGGAVDQDAGLTCARRGLPWLVGGDALDVQDTLTFIAWCGLILSFCCARSCGAIRGGASGQRPSVSMRQVRELRSQLAQIPTEPPSRPAAEGPPAGGGGSAAETDPGYTSDGGAGEVCPICQNDIVVRVAFRPCGHTACRDCVGRVVEINQRCHICRASIEGVQPVYI
mmetsp:Transcript_49179/g.130595  ORF Transcript_49179/g.130595 Transcript_49179/m.130595 type:complete len:637 (+) Transcript_49179:75-1985(+)